tara:strand:+ start:1981 stop:2763 length:783 start_codon:yes stop_codon:yes gene_type:complete
MCLNLTKKLLPISLLISFLVGCYEDNSNITINMSNSSEQEATAKESEESMEEEESQESEEEEVTENQEEESEENEEEQNDYVDDITNLLVTYWNGDQEIFAAMDLSDNSFVDLAVLEGVVTLSAGQSTFDSETHRYIIGTNLGITIVDAQNGNILETIPNELNMKGLEYDSASNQIFGSYWNGNQEIFATLDLSDKSFDDLAVLEGVVTLSAGQSTFDSETHRYIVGTNLGITIVDTQNGNILETIPNELNMKGFEFNLN